MELPLTEMEVRILGTLMEKQVTTPDLYPLSLNSLTNGCNQKTSRAPITNYSERELENALEKLGHKRLTAFGREPGGRTPKYSQYLARELRFEPQHHALMCVLMLRGPQTMGELRARTEQMHKFESLEAVQHALEQLTTWLIDPLVIELPRQAGERDNRWTHMLCGAPTMAVMLEPRVSSASEMTARVEALEVEVRELREELEKIKAKAG